MAERKNELRKTLAQFTRGQLQEYRVKITTSLAERSYDPALTYGDLADLIEPDPKKKQHALYAVNAIQELTRDGINLEQLERILVWSDTEPNRIKLEIFKKNPSIKK